MQDIDTVDLKLLRALQENCHTKLEALAVDADISVSSASTRVRQLRESGVIRREVALLDGKRLGLGGVAFIRVLVGSSRRESGFLKGVSQLQEILECHRITGEYSYLLKVVLADVRALEDLISELKHLPGVERCDSMISLSVHKESTQIPLRIE